MRHYQICGEKDEQNCDAFGRVTTYAGRIFNTHRDLELTFDMRHLRCAHLVVEIVSK